MDLREGIPRLRRARLPIRVGGLALVPVGMVIAALAILRLASRTPGDPTSTLLGLGGGVLFAGLGVFVAYVVGTGGVARLQINEGGLQFTDPKGRVRTLAWANPRFLVDVYDVSRIPAGRSYAVDDEVWRYAVIVQAPFRLICRTPREAYEAVLTVARAHEMAIDSQSSFYFRSHEDAVAFRIRRAK
ncbi:MAG: hypothetical protein L3K05_04505 [Thermoplasmata archaeon]|nr:hypothetical protein [Thermoplasmata archaeon]